jgi:lipocalin
MTHHDNMPGEFLLHFPELTSQAMHVWVLHLGPLDKNGLYSYAITSDPTGTVMWVLARNVTEFNLLYDADAHAKLEELGFKDGGKTPVASYQGNDCTYENTDPVEVVQHLDLNKYYGSYYEMYTDNFVDATWESGTYCSVFAFSPNDDGTVGFHNAENRGAPNGTAEVVDGECLSIFFVFLLRYRYMIFIIVFLFRFAGYMVISDPMQPAKFDLNIPTVMHRSVPYWVLAVGPLDSDSMYSYVIMGGSAGLTMWVLARNVSEFNMNYDSDVKALLEDMGYIYGDRSLVSTYQGQYCVYETPTSHGDNNDDEMSAGAKAGLGLIVAIAVGMFLLAGVMFVKNRPSLRHRSSASDKVELVSGDTSDA